MTETTAGYGDTKWPAHAFDVSEDHNPQTVLTACPRSGSSLGMLLFRHGLGPDLCVGFKHPMQEALKEYEEQAENESDIHFKIRRYCLSKDPERARIERMITHSYKMNPYGFWEHGRHVKHGIRYNVGNQLPAGGYVKVITTGLIATDPRYVKNLVYMIRHPRAVAKSQERLRHRGVAREVIGQIHTPAMFIQSTFNAAKWITQNQNVPLLQMQFDDLIRYPQQEVDRLAEFLGVGNWDGAADIIKPKLNRSKPLEINHELWEDAEEVWEMLKAGDFKGIVEFSEDKNTATKQSNDHWYCTRYGRNVNSHMCEECQNNPVVMENYKETALRLGIDHENEPCAYECGMNRHLQDEEIKTVKISIKRSHWKGENAPKHKQFCKHRGLDIIDWIPCGSCKGNVKIGVHECAIFGKCTVKKKVALEIQVCHDASGGCGRFELADEPEL